MRCTAMTNDCYIRWTDLSIYIEKHIPSMVMHCVLENTTREYTAT